MPKAYYNEFDPYAAQWLRNLIAAGHIAPGEVDQRNIEDVRPSDLAGYTQCHFFAGVGVWSLALRRAGWADSRPVWTGSCPCQPFSAAGKGNGFADERHLWPAWFHLIGQRSPVVVFGEQVSSKDADIWVDLVQTDMEALGYAFGAVPFPSAGVGAPHIRDRLYWLANSQCEQRQECLSGLGKGDCAEGSGTAVKSTGLCLPLRLADSASNRRVGDGKGSAIQTGRNSGPEQSGLMAVGLEGCPLSGISEAPRMAISPVDNANDAGLEGFGSGHKTEGGRFGEVRPVAPASESCRVEYATGDGREQRGTESGRGSIAAGCTLSGLGDDQLQQRPHGEPGVGVKHDTGRRKQSTAAITGLCGDSVPGPVNGRWSDADWLFCRDGKWRPVEPGTSPLANGAPARVGRLRAYGNAINAEAAEAVIRAYMECRP